MEMYLAIPIKENEKFAMINEAMSLCAKEQDPQMCKQYLRYAVAVYSKVNFAYVESLNKDLCKMARKQFQEIKELWKFYETFF